MPFIGQQPQTGAYHKLDSITTSATATYNLQLNGGAYSPTSANHLLVSLNGVMQALQDSFTVSGSTITFASALTSSDNIDFIMALGDVLDIGVPSDGAVNTSQLANSAVTDAKMASTLDLSGKTVTYGLSRTDIPAGTIIQVARGEPGQQRAAVSAGMTNPTVAPTTSNTTSLWTYTFTPTASGNKILMIYQSQYDHSTNTTWAFHTVFEGSTYLQGSYNYARYSSSEPYAHAWTYEYTTTSATAVTFDFRYAVGTSGYINLNRSDSYTGSGVTRHGTSCLFMGIAQ